jgi:heptaprenylglyceryl phosphate synthase
MGIAGAVTFTGTASNAADAVATSADNSKGLSWLYGFNGVTWDRLRVDGSKNLDVNCTVGCGAGTFNNNTDAVATSATNGQSAAWLYGWNGASFDRLQVDASKFLKVVVSGALPAGSAVIGHVITDSGSVAAATLQTQTDTVMVGGVNLKEINGVVPLMGNGITGTGSQRVTIASDNSPITVAQATASNLNALVVGNISNAGSAVATAATNVPSVAYNYGFNGTTWDQLQVDGSKFLKTVISGALPAGSAVIGHVITDSGSVANATLQTQTDTVMVGGVNVKEINAVPVLMGNGITGTGSQRVTIASDNTAFSVNATLQTQTDTVMVGGANIKEINAITPLMGNGVTGTGSLRVTIASDNTAFAVTPTGNFTAADGIALTSSMKVASIGEVYNGTTADLARSVTNGMNSTGAGIQVTGLAGQCDDTSPTAITENSWGNQRIDCATHAQYAENLPSASAAAGIAAVVSGSLETGHVLKAGAGNLYGVEVATTTVAGYLEVFNSTTVPAAGAVTPVAACYVAAFATCALNFSPPLVMSTGISAAFSASTTPFTKTDSATAFIAGQTL